MRVPQCVTTTRLTETDTTRTFTRWNNNLILILTFTSPPFIISDPLLQLHLYCQLRVHYNLIFCRLIDDTFYNIIIIWIWISKNHKNASFKAVKYTVVVSIYICYSVTKPDSIFNCCVNYIHNFSFKCL